MTARLALCLLALTTAGCWSDEPPAVDNGRFVLTKSLDGPPLFIEGSVTHVRLVRDPGTTLVDEVQTAETLKAPLIDEPLPPGSYALETVERPCSGNCGYLDAPVESTRCKLGVRVEAGRSTKVSLVLTRSEDRSFSRCELAD